MNSLIRFITAILAFGPVLLFAQDTASMHVFLADLNQFQELMAGEQSFSLTMQVEVTQDGRTAPAESITLDHQAGRTRVQYGDLIKLIVDTVALTVDEGKQLISIELNRGEAAHRLAANHTQLSEQMAPYAQIIAENQKLRTYKFELSGEGGIESYEASFNKESGFFPLTRIIFQNDFGQSEQEAIEVKTSMESSRLSGPPSLAPYLATCKEDKLCLGADYKDYRVLSVSPRLATQFNPFEAQ